jgi:hypothetical protein
LRLFRSREKAAMNMSWAKRNNARPMTKNRSPSRASATSPAAQRRSATNRSRPAGPLTAVRARTERATAGTALTAKCPG